MYVHMKTFAMGTTFNHPIVQTFIAADIEEWHTGVAELYLEKLLNKAGLDKETEAAIVAKIGEHNSFRIGHCYWYFAMKFCVYRKLPGLLERMLGVQYNVSCTLTRFMMNSIICGGYRLAGELHDEGAHAATVEEGMDALLYAARHVRRTFNGYRLLNVPLQPFGHCTLLSNLCVLGKPDLVHRLLRHGAHVHYGIFDDMLNELSRPSAMDTHWQCFRLLAKSTTRVFSYIGGSKRTWQDMQEKYEIVFRSPNMTDDLRTKCGAGVSSLKHLSRCGIRDRLGRNYALPDGIGTLSLPNDLQNYVDLQ